MTDHNEQPASRPATEWDNALLAQVVAEVVRRLAMTNDDQAASAEASNATGRSPGELVLAEPVVTWRQLDGRLDGVRQVVIGERTVVTPAVRDELARRNISLLRRPGRSLKQVLVIDQSTEHVGSRLRTKEWELRALSCGQKILDYFTKIVSQGGCGAWITERPASAVCRANSRGLRAYVAWNDQQWRSALVETELRLLVLDARHPQPEAWERWIRMLRNQAGMKGT